MPLSAEIKAIQEARRQLAEDNRRAHIGKRYATEVFLLNATLAECHHVLTCLIERVSSITGEAGKLEDAACEMKDQIDSGEYD